MGLKSNISACARVITSHFHSPYTVVRSDPGSYNSSTGLWSNTTSNVTVLANVEFVSDFRMKPLYGEILKTIPSGRIVEKMYRVFTADMLYTDSGNRKADTIIIDGEEYQIIKEGPEAVAVKLGT